MQTIEKALHQPMPFTTGGQTITDRLNAAKHSLAGSQLGKTICKATTEELMAPKKKHLDYLLHCTNEPNVSIPQMANLLIERTQNPNWTVVYKSLITIHNIMCYGNERFSQYLASCNTTFNLGTFLDRTTSGYDMSTHVRRYGKYIGEKIATYRTCAFDFCKVKRGREDGLLRTMHTDKLLKTLPTLQNQIDALLEFSVSAGELNNGVINCSFILLFRDLIRLFACYNDGVINLLEKYFDMNKKQARDALDMYKTFLTRLDKVSDFLRVAESVGIERAEIPDLTRAPASLLEALEAHLAHLEGRPAVAASNPFAGGGGGMGGGHAAPNFFGGQTAYQPASATAAIGEAERNKSLELERAHLRQFEEARRAAGGGASTNPFSAPAAAPAAGPQPDLIDIFSAPQTMQQQQAAMPFDATNPFASFGAPAPGPAHSMMYGGAPVSNAPSYAMAASSNGFGADFTRAFSAPAPPPTSSIASTPSTFSNGNGRRPSKVPNPFMTGGGGWGAPHQPPMMDPAAYGHFPPAAGHAPPPPMPPPPMAHHQGAPPVPPPPPAAPTSSDPPNPFLASAPDTPVQTVTSQPMPIGPPTEPHNLGIYSDTPFSRFDGSYNNPGPLQMAAMQGAPVPPGYDYAAGDAAKFGGDVDSALSNLATNLDISGHATQGKPVQWPNAPPARPPMGAPVGGYNPYVPTGMPPGGPMMQPMGGWGGPQQHPQMMGMYGGPPAGYGMPPQAGGPMGYGGMGMGQQQQQQPFQ